MVFAALLSVGAITVGILVWRVDADDIKRLLTDYVYEKKQRRVVWQGHIDVQWFPSISLRSGALSVSGQGGAGHLASVRSMAVDIAWLPLLVGNVIVEKLAVSGARLFVIRHADGRLSIEDFMTDEDSESPVDIVVRKAKISDAVLRFDDRQQQRVVIVRDFALRSLGLLGTQAAHSELSFYLGINHPPVDLYVRGKGETAAGNGRFRLRAASMHIRGNAFKATAIDALATGTITPRGYSGGIAIDNFRLRANAVYEGQRVQARLQNAKAVWDGKRLRAVDAQAVVSALGPQASIGLVAALPRVAVTFPAINVPDFDVRLDYTAAQNQLHSRIQGAASADWRTQRLNLHDLEGSLRLRSTMLSKGELSLRVQGMTSVDLANERIDLVASGSLDESAWTGRFNMQGFAKPHNNLTVAIDKLNLDRYIPSTSRSTTNDTPAMTMDRLRALRANGEVTIGALGYAKVQARNVRLQVQ